MKKLTIPEAELPEYIKKLRGKMTQEEFGKSLGVSKQAVTQYESGVAKPKAETLALMGLEKCYRSK